MGADASPIGIDLDRLEEIARGATPGRRYLQQDRNDQWNVYAESPKGTDWLAILPHQCVVSIEEERARDALLFEATPPEVVLELIRIARTAQPPMVSILADVAEDATAMRIRELEQQNAALTAHLAAIGAAVDRLPRFNEHDGDVFACAPRINAAAEAITDLRYRIDEYERLAEGSRRDLATSDELLQSRTATIIELDDYLRGVCTALGAATAAEQSTLSLVDVIAQGVGVLRVGRSAMERLRNEAEAQASALRSDLDDLTAKHDALLLASLASPWEDLAKKRGQELDEIEERIQTIADEAFGPFEIQTPAQNMDAIEAGIGGLVTRLREATRPRKAAPPRAPKPGRKKPTPKAKAKPARRR